VSPLQLDDSRSSIIDDDDEPMDHREFPFQRILLRSIIPVVDRESRIARWILLRKGL